MGLIQWKVEINVHVAAIRHTFSLTTYKRKGSCHVLSSMWRKIREWYALLSFLRRKDFCGRLVDRPKYRRIRQA